MKKFLLSLLCLLAVFPAAWGADVTTTYQFKEGTSSGITDDKEGSWVNNNPAFNFSSNQTPGDITVTTANSRGISTSTTSSITSNNEFTNVTKIIVDVSTNGAANKNSFSVKIGDTQIGEPKNLAKSNHQQLEFTSATPLTGNITFSVTRSEKTIWIAGFQVTEKINNDPVDPEFGFAKDPCTVMMDDESNLTALAQLPLVGDLSAEDLVWSVESAPEGASYELEEGFFMTDTLGEYEVKASFAGNDRYNAKDVYCTIVVTPFVRSISGSVDLSFTGMGVADDNKQGWTSSYGNVSYSKDNFDIEFYNCNQNASTITDCPVSKNGNVVVSLNCNSEFKYIKFTLKQWSSKTKTAKLQYSINGEDFLDFNPSITSDNFVIEATDIPAGAIAIKLDLSSESSNQVGIVSFDYKITVPTKLAGFAYAGEGYHEMVSMAHAAETGAKVEVKHDVLFGGSDGSELGHYELVNVEVAPADNFADYLTDESTLDPTDVDEDGNLTWKFANKGASATFEAADGEGELSHVFVKAHTAGVYNVTLEQTEDIDCGSTILKSGKSDPISVLVRPSVLGIGLAFNWYPVHDENGEYVAYYDPNYSEQDKDYGDKNEIIWTASKAIVNGYEAVNDENLEIYWKPVAEEVEEPVTPIAFLGARAASDLENVTSEAIPEGYTKFEGTTTAPDLTANNKLMVLVRQNGILSAETPVTLRSLDDFNDPTAVEAIEAAEDGEAVYYTLDGVRVANPEKGLYIVVKGGKAQKIYKTL